MPLQLRSTYLVARADSLALSEPLVGGHTKTKNDNRDI